MDLNLGFELELESVLSGCGTVEQGGGRSLFRHTRVVGSGRKYCVDA